MLIDRRRFMSLAALATTAAEDAPGGRIETLPKLGSAPSTEPRIRVWLPLGYAKSGRRHDLQTRRYRAGHAFAETAAQMDERLAWLFT